jgi:PAS domain S-box-containing protein
MGAFARTYLHVPEDPHLGRRWWHNRPSRFKSVYSALVPALTILVALTSLLIVGGSQNYADQAVVQANKVQASAEGALTLLIGAETGVRGYQATGEALFLAPYDQAIAEWPESLSALGALVADEPAQASRVGRVRSLAASELSTLGSLLQQVETGAGQDDRSFGLDASGKRTMDAIRGEVRSIEAVETKVQQARQAQYHDLKNVALIIIMLGGLGGLGGLLFALVLNAFAEEGRRRAEANRASQALRASEADGRLNALLLASSAEGIATVAIDGVCTSINPTGARMLGYQQNEVIGQEMHLLVHHHHGDGSAYPAAACKIKVAIESAEECRVDDEVFWRKDGTRLPVEYSAAPLLIDGDVMGAVVSFADTTKRRGFDSAAERQAAELRAAITRRELVLHYQPKVELATGAVIGVEALVRWQHPQRGLVFPDEFIPLAERSGVIADLTAFVLEEAVDQQVRWRSTGLELPVAVNLSVDSLSDPGFPDRLGGLCRRYGVAPCDLELEVTESGVMAEPTLAIVVLEALAATGFALAIDDFGTGFSSLAYLRDLPVSLVKIDKSFVMNLPRSDRDAHIVRGIVDLVHGLGKRVVAEGVETAEGLAFLLGVGCDIGQGYQWSRPLPAPRLTLWLQEYHRRSIPRQLLAPNP